MSVSSGAERINPVTDIQRRFNPFWAEVVSQYTEVYGGERSVWPACSGRLGVWSLRLDPRHRVLKIGLDQSTEVEIHFSGRGNRGPTLGLTVNSGNWVEHISENNMRQRYPYTGGVMPEFIWRIGDGSDADLVEARAHFGREKSVRYYGDPAQHPPLKYREWQRIWQKRGFATYNEPSLELAASAPHDLRDVSSLFGANIEWSKDIASFSDAVLRRARVSEYPDVLPPFKLRKS